MKPGNLVLRCYAKREGEQWVAVCIDLCLAAQGDNFNEARDKLYQQIASYIDEALTEDQEFASQLLNRRAPATQRLQYWVIVALAKLHILRMGVGKAFNTIMPLHTGKNCHV